MFLICFVKVVSLRRPLRVLTNRPCINVVTNIADLLVESMVPLQLAETYDKGKKLSWRRSTNVEPTALNRLELKA